MLAVGCMHCEHSLTHSVCCALLRHCGVMWSDPVAVLRGITLRNIAVTTGKGDAVAQMADRAGAEKGSLWLQCDGIPESLISGITFENVTVHGSSKQECMSCKIEADSTSKPQPKCKSEL